VDIKDIKSIFGYPGELGDDNLEMIADTMAKTNSNVSRLIDCVEKLAGSTADLSEIIKDMQKRLEFLEQNFTVTTATKFPPYP
jgi:hypothetical protein